MPSAVSPLPGCAFAPRCVLRDTRLHRGTAGPDRRRRQAGSAPASCRSTTWPNELGGASTNAGETFEAPPPTTCPPSVVVRDVTKTFSVKRRFLDRSTGGDGKLHALRGISLTRRARRIGGTRRRERLGQVHPAARHRRPGEADRRVRSNSRTVQRPQMVFQDAGASLTPWLSVGELISERLRKREDVARQTQRGAVAEVLDRVGLPLEIAKSRAGQLSGGQRQRVSLARATVVPPSVLLCDEPTSALDVSLAASVLNLIGDLRRSLDMSVVFVTHDLSVARVVADRIAVMYLGRIVEVGPADDVINRPTHPYTQAARRLDTRPRPRITASWQANPPARCPRRPAAHSIRGAPSRSTPAMTISSTSGWRASRAARTRWPASRGGQADGDRSPGRPAGPRQAATTADPAARRSVTAVNWIGRVPAPRRHRRRGRRSAVWRRMIRCCPSACRCRRRERTASCSAPTASAATSCPGCSTGCGRVGSPHSSVVAVGLLFGGLIGLIAGATGGWIDSVLMRITDGFLSLPAPVLAIAVVAALGPGFVHTLVAVSIVWWPFYATAGPRRGRPTRRTATRRGRETRWGEPYSARRAAPSARRGAQRTGHREPRPRHADPDPGGAVLPRPRPVGARSRARRRCRPQPELLPSAVVGPGDAGPRGAGSGARSATSRETACATS